ncbi:hypothetical protein [Glycomyces arizonensis]|nr:hypothetical protein [Glycomyces arizonensis]
MTGEHARKAVSGLARSRTAPRPVRAAVKKVVEQVETYAEDRQPEP